VFFHRSKFVAVVCPLAGRRLAVFKIAIAGRLRTVFKLVAQVIRCRRRDCTRDGRAAACFRWDFFVCGPSSCAVSPGWSV
jgi:hypothetical protein